MAVKVEKYVPLVPGASPTPEDTAPTLAGVAAVVAAAHAAWTVTGAQIEALRLGAKAAIAAADDADAVHAAASVLWP